MIGKNSRGGGARARCALLLSLVLPACLDRPVCGDCAPQTTDQFVLPVSTGGVHKIDLLFMIDDSASMADKQKLLASAVPSLLSRFTTPLCLDGQGNANGALFSNGACASGVPEFSPIQDIHIGIVTSSLGIPGLSSGLCAPPNGDDRGELLPKARAGSATLPSWNGSGFLAWDPTGTRDTPPGTESEPTLQSDFQNQVAAVGEAGCGYEASLEAWYRFLIEPDPAQSIVAGLANGVTVSVPQGLDSELLAERAAFLRPDSLVAVLMLTDENDCSVLRYGPGISIANRHLPPPTSACAQDPNSPCCRSCDSRDPTPPNCTPTADDPACTPSQVDAAADDPNLRCFDQKRRFGVDLLEPVERYVRGLTAPTVPDRNGVEQPNPLFSAQDGKPARDASSVYLAGIVGVPWQDIATPDSLNGSGLRYLKADELSKNNVWDLILGDPEHGVLPSDPHMIESATPRTGSHPFVPNATLAPASAATPPTADVINGHEQATPSDLEYACIFALDTPLDCASTTASCDCQDMAALAANRPLCQPPAGGAFGHTQYYAKAYPGVRELEVLKGVGAQAIVASICPKLTRSANPESDANYGYNPAVNAIVESLRVKLADQCLPRAPTVDANGQTSCVVLETKFDGSCDCTKPGRSVPDAQTLASVRRTLKNAAECDTATTPACSALCGCTLAQATGPALDTCRSATAATAQAAGFCYVDPGAGLGDASLTEHCTASQRRLLRFVGDDTPTQGSIAYMACEGSALEGAH